MKKILTVLFVTVVAGLGAAHAQSTIGTTNVHVQLTDVLSLTVNDPDVYINFANEADYKNGVEVPMSSHLTVTSNQNYTLNVKCAGNLTGTGSNADVLSPSVLRVEMPAGGNNTSLGVTPAVANGLSQSDFSLLTSALPAVQKALDVTYSVPAAISNTSAILGKNADTYTTVVTYTVTAN
ncbi:hypothetical protein LJ707_02835 [Mucilaginibacter sp. UR6-1]|uniref:hypothetical protein n=1 Tax=Mucilaginibacter sp. UR6-1 TaxID=1435643 RepID=UPI001E35E4AF|nr:hypothetical protein [Mucilaginibacter sp. UR6-1]MCC8407848.1 hypothetical protein [Mucilaginibacter sp. UR6-1]